MGATNALAAYRRWAGRLPGTSMQLLTYMALVSKDKDDWPWYGQGQEALAEFALGRPNPDRSDLRAVQRAMGPLLEAGAVTVDRAGAARNDGNTTARYRLNLTDRADDERRAWEQTPDGKRRTSDGRKGRKSSPRKAATPDGNRRVDNFAQDPEHPTVSGQDIRRFPTQHPTVCDATPDGNRRTKEEEDQEERENRGTKGDVRTAVTVARASAPDEPIADVIEMFPEPESEPPPAPEPPPPPAPPKVGRPRWSSRGTDAIAEAQARVAARKAEYQAQLAAGSTP